MSDCEELIKEKLKENSTQFQKFVIKTKNDITEAMEKKFGNDVIRVVENLVKEENLNNWKMLAEKELKEGRKNDIEGIIRTLWEPLKDRFDYTVEKTSEGTQIYCTKCPLADYAKEMNSTKWAFHYYCGSDEWIVKGFNPKIGFKRSKTLMEGHDCCNHFYYYKSE